MTKNKDSTLIPSNVLLIQENLVLNGSSVNPPTGGVVTPYKRVIIKPPFDTNSMIYLGTSTTIILNPSGKKTRSIIADYKLYFKL